MRQPIVKQQTKPKLSPLEEKYKELSEVYLAKYEQQIDREVKMMIAKGVIVEMESDLAFFHLKSPRTDKSQNQLDRLDILRGIVEEFSSIQSFNWQVNQVLGKFYRENQKLKQRIGELEAENERLKFLAPEE